MASATDAATVLFADRRDAGRQLAVRLAQYRARSPVVLALPRGGVVVAAEVVRALGVPSGVVVARKLPAPGFPGLGIGALAEGGVRIIDSLAVRLLGVSDEQLAGIEATAQASLADYRDRYRGDRPIPETKDRTVILVDDGLASGLTARAAIEYVARQKPRRIILAVPVGGPDVCAAVLKWVDELVAVAVPPEFLFVDDWYGDFDDCTDAMVAAALDDAQPPCSPCTSSWSPEDGMTLECPETAPRGVVLFAHGAGSDRNSPRNRLAASAFVRAGLATLRFDLLTPGEVEAEARTRHLRFNVGLLTERVIAATRWLESRAATRGLRIGYFGSSTGAAAMLAAATRIGSVAAVVSRGGRPDLVEARLSAVRAPTLFLVGGNDSATLDRNQRAFVLLGSPEKQLDLIEGATHLFEEPGAMEDVSGRASAWFTRHLTWGSRRTVPP